jgi:hypothetical protein
LDYKRGVFCGHTLALFRQKNQLSFKGSRRKVNHQLGIKEIAARIVTQGG